MRNRNEMMDIENNSMPEAESIPGSALKACEVVSFKNHLSENGVFGGIPNASFIAFPVPVIFSGWERRFILGFFKPFVPCAFPAFGFDPTLFKNWVSFQPMVNLAPVVKRFMSRLISHAFKSRTGFFCQTLIPSPMIFHRLASTVMPMDIFGIKFYPIFILGLAACFFITPAFASHGIHYTSKFVRYQEKPGELLENPNVKSRAISSQAASGDFDSAEGSETNGVSPNKIPYTSARPEREDIVRAMQKCMEPRNKQPWDNKLNSVPFTGKIETLSEFDIKEIIREGLMDDMVKVFDGEVERQFNQTQLRYVGTSATGYALTTNGTATATNTSVLNKYHFKNIIDEMTNRNIPGWDKADGDYVCIGGPLALRGIRDDLEGINQYTDSGVQKVWNREIGRYYGCRVVEDTFASRYLYNSTTRAATLKTWPAAALSMDAYFFGPGTVREAIVEPEHIRVKVPTDYGRSKGIGWYSLGGWKIDREDEPNARIVKWDSAGAA